MAKPQQLSYILARAAALQSVCREAADWPQHHWPLLLSLSFLEAKTILGPLDVKVSQSQSKEV